MELTRYEIAGRKIKKGIVSLGARGDSGIRTIEFELPRIAAGQIAYLKMDFPVPVKAPLKEEIGAWRWTVEGGATGRAGEFLAQIEIFASDALVWNSEMFFVEVRESVNANAVIEPVMLPELLRAEAALREANDRTDEILAAVDAEEVRVQREEARADAEAGRQENEDARIAEETLRNSAEAARVNAEDARKAAETARLIVDDKRAADDQAWTEAEEKRQAAEAERALAENARQENWDTLSAHVIGKADYAAEISDRFSDVSMEVEMLAPGAQATADVEQTEKATTFKLGVPSTNLSYATFEVDENMDLLMHTPDGYDGVTFALNNGCLEVEIL